MNMNQENDNDLRKDAPFLSSLEKKNSFPAPEGYFENLPTQIQNKINGAGIKNHPVLFSVKYIKYAAAAMVLIIAGFYFYPKKTQQPKDTFTAANVYALSDDELLDEMSDFPIESETEVTTSNENSEIINYLIDNKVDVTEINGI